MSSKILTDWFVTDLIPNVRNYHEKFIICKFANYGQCSNQSSKTDDNFSRINRVRQKSKHVLKEFVFATGRYTVEQSKTFKSNLKRNLYDSKIIRQIFVLFFNNNKNNIYGNKFKKKYF